MNRIEKGFDPKCTQLLLLNTLTFFCEIHNKRSSVFEVIPSFLKFQFGNTLKVTDDGRGREDAVGDVIEEIWDNVCRNSAKEQLLSHLLVSLKFEEKNGL
jgi:hypothetical protein